MEKNESVILIYSPKERMRSLLAAGLKQYAFDVIEVSNTQVVIVKANQCAPDIVILDITSNPRDFIVVKRIKDNLRTKNTKVLIISISELNEIIEKLSARLQLSPSSSDADKKPESYLNVINFPFKFSEFTSKIQSILNLKTLDVVRSVSDSGLISDIEASLLSKKVTHIEKLKLISQSIEKQWAFSHTVLRALEIVDRNTSSTKELAKCIESDLAATSAILKIANTAFYAKIQGKFDNVLNAIVRIGFNETKNLLAGLTLIELAPQEHKTLGFSRKEFWMHSLAVGLLSEKLTAHAQKKRSVRGKELQAKAFIAGLLHDIGKIPLDNKFLTLFMKILATASSEIIPYIEAENRLIGINHCSLGHYLLNRWKIPAPASSVVLNHHTPESIQNITNRDEKLINGIVFASNIYSKALEFGHSCDNFIGEIPQSIIKELDLTESDFSSILDQVSRELSVLCTYLRIASKEFDIEMKQQFPDDKDIDICLLMGKDVEMHPLCYVLKNSKFKVITINESDDENSPDVKIKIHIPDEDELPDVTFRAEEKGATESNDSELEIFLLQNDIDYLKINENYKNSNTVILNRNKIELRVLLHYIDFFLEKGRLPDDLPKAE